MANKKKKIIIILNQVYELNAVSNLVLSQITKLTYSICDAFSVKANRFGKMFTSILSLFFLF